MISSNPLPANRPEKPPVWRLHRFTRNAAAPSSLRTLDEDIHSFFTALLQHFSGNGHWMAATAPAKEGGVDVWFKLPEGPADAGFGATWIGHLESLGLASQAVTGRN